MIDQILQYDTELFIFLNSLGVKTWDPFWLAYTSKWNWIPFYALLLYLIFRYIGLKPMLITMVIVALMILATDQTTNLFKHGLHRLRPCHLAEIIERMRLVREGCGGQYGFFSGHASNTMAAAIFIGLMLKKKFKYLIYILIFWAMLMAYSRVYIGVHYPLDIVIGMSFGAIMGYVFYRANVFAMQKIVNYELGYKNH
ncbi:MAG: phosphatase PAP2 family protein [Aquaticitalea sp.]